MIRFNTEQKFFIYTLVIIYTEVIISVFAAAIFQAYWTIGITIASGPLSYGLFYTYKLRLYKRAVQEIGSLNYIYASIVSKDGTWNTIEFGLRKYELINISDQDQAKFEKSKKFKDSLDEISKSNPDLQKRIDETKLNDTFVDTQLSAQYTLLKLSTSRQIFLYELIKKFEDDPAKLSKLETELSNIKSDDYGKKTDYLENAFNVMKIDKELYNDLNIKNELYKDQTIGLSNVTTVNRDKNEIKKQIKIHLIPYAFLILGVILQTSLISTIFGNIGDRNIINANSIPSIYTLIVFSIIVIIVGIFVNIKGFIYLKKIISKPTSIVFENNVSNAQYIDALCYVRSRLSEITADSYIYKIIPRQDPNPRKLKEGEEAAEPIYGRNWDCDYIYMVLPCEMGTLDFTPDTIYHRNNVIQIRSAPVIVFEIGTLFDNIPMYLVTGCNYHFKRMAKTYYDYNVFQNWKEKIYCWIISNTETDLQLKESENMFAKSRADKWEESFKNVSQLASNDYITQQQETGKVGQDNYNIDNRRDSGAAAANEKLAAYKQQVNEAVGKLQAGFKKTKTILTVVIVIMAILLIGGIILWKLTPATPTK